MIVLRDLAVFRCRATDAALEPSLLDVPAILVARAADLNARERDALVQDTAVHHSESTNMAYSVRLSRRALFGSPVLLVLYLAAGCAGLTAPWTAPEVALLGAQPKLLGLDRQSFLVNLGVTNPNDRALPIKALSYRVQVEGQDLAEGSSELARLIPAGATEQVDVEVNSNLLGLMPSLPGLLLTRDTLAWTVSGIAYVDAGGVRLPVPYRHSGTIAPGALLSSAAF
jgi:LEA14-like dessication related protein